MNAQRNQKSFTLIETIVATLLLSLAVVALTGMTVRSLQMVQSVMITEQAWDLVDRQLAMVDYIGIGSYGTRGPSEGSFKGDGVEFHWKLNITQTAAESLYDIMMTVSWTQHKRTKTIRAQTRLSGHE